MGYVRQDVLLGEPPMMFTDNNIKSVKMTRSISIIQLFPISINYSIDLMEIQPKKCIE